MTYDWWRKRLQSARHDGMTDEFAKAQFGHDLAELTELARAEEAREAVPGSTEAADEARRLHAAADEAQAKADAIALKTAERQRTRDKLVARIADLKATIPALEGLIESTVANQAAADDALAASWSNPDFVIRQPDSFAMISYRNTLARAQEIPLELTAQRAALVRVREELKTAEAQLRKVERE